VYVRNNVEGTVNVLEAAIKSGTGNFIFASTSSVYGINPTPFSENTPTDAPLSPYPATKKACEVMLKAYAINNDINVTVLRIFNPIGPRLRPDLLLPKLIRSCIYEGFECPVYWTPEDLGKIKRDYTYINHMFEAIERIMETPFKYEIFNMGNSAPISLVEMFAAVEKVVGKKPMTKLMPHRQGEMLETYADIQKAKAELGYNPITSIEESIKLFYDWFMLQDDAYKKGNL
ncbi:NAD-dependent epimerase/dehydratase family protein, partial [Patescibacteria group bacterium]|nr:NAD-dependent epimerase/dehydratase family protein [Patescibacteria group bacterium]